jgi:hypothetical protein
MRLRSVHARVTLLLLLTGGSAGACKRGAPTTCHDDVDCPAGFDCVATACVRRERLRFGTDARPARADASAAPAPNQPLPDAGSPVIIDAAPARPVAPPARSPAPESTPPAGQPRLPMWKERLKNS